MNGPQYSRRALSVLIVSSDPMGAALIGAAIEIAGFRVSYANEGESTPDAIRRVKPVAVLAEANAVAADPASLGPARMTGAAIVIYGAPARLRDLTVIAGSVQATLLAIPDDVEELPALLTRLGAAAPGRATSE